VGVKGTLGQPYFSGDFADRSAVVAIANKNLECGLNNPLFAWFVYGGLG
jgi:hypothetical protein